MAQIASWTLVNAAGAAFRAALNNALAAIQSSSSGATAPASPVPGMPWLDTSGAIAVLKIRNAANSGWVALGPEQVAAISVRGNSAGAAGAVGDIDMATLRAILGFSGITGVNHYLVLPTGKILQRGIGTTNASGQVAVTFPTAFTTTNYSLIGIHVGAGAAFCAQNAASKLAASGQLNVFLGGGAAAGAGLSVEWFAEGY